MSSALPWVFITVAFVACAAAFFAWGRLQARLARHETSRLEPGPPPAGPTPATPSPEPAGATVDPQAWLEAMPGVALLARRQPAGFAVLCLNAQARQQWPHAGAGTALETLSGLTVAGRTAMESLAPGVATQFDGWRFARLSAAPAPGTSAAPGAENAQMLITALPAAASESEIFGSTLSHDLRAPIRVVEGFTRIVKEDYGSHLDRVGNEHLERVLGATARMNLMIDALLTMARLSAQPLARQPVDLSQLASYVLEDLHKGGGLREVEIDIQPGLQASGDPTLLRLVLENLLGNAWKYTARTPSARIGLRRTTHEGQGAFAVVDNGAGFDMRSSDRLFGLFQRLHSAADFPGHGVGLASVRRIVRRHGGDIWAEGRPGHGATFTFTLG